SPVRVPKPERFRRSNAAWLSEPGSLNCVRNTPPAALPMAKAATRKTTHAATTRRRRRYMMRASLGSRASLLFRGSRGSSRARCWVAVRSPFIPGSPGGHAAGARSGRSSDAPKKGDGAPSPRLRGRLSSSGSRGYPSPRPRASPLQEILEWRRRAAERGRDGVVGDGAVDGVDAPGELRVRAHRVGDAERGERERVGQRRVRERVGRGVRDGAGDVADRVVQDAVAL